MSDGDVPTVVPDEVRRMRLEPGERLIVRSASLTSGQAHEQLQYLQAWFPDNDVIVIVADEIAVEASAAKPVDVIVQGGSTLMTAEDIDRFAAKVGERITRSLLPRGGVRMSQRGDRIAAAEVDADYIQSAMPSPEEIRKLRHPSDDDPDDGLAGIPARR